MKNNLKTILGIGTGLWLAFAPANTVDAKSQIPTNYDKSSSQYGLILKAANDTISSGNYKTLEKKNYKIELEFKDKDKNGRVSNGDFLDVVRYNSENVYSSASYRFNSSGAEISSPRDSLHGLSQVAINAAIMRTDVEKLKKYFSHIFDAEYQKDKRYKNSERNLKFLDNHYNSHKKRKHYPKEISPFLFGKRKHLKRIKQRRKPVVNPAFILKSK